MACTPLTCRTPSKQAPAPEWPNGQPAPAPQWLIDMCGCAPERKQAETSPPERVDQKRAATRAIHYLEQEAPEAVEGAGGDHTTYTVACKVKDYGVPEIEAVALMLDHWNDRCAPPWAPEELRVKVANAYRYGVDPVGSAAPEAQFEPVDLTFIAEQSEAQSKASDAAVAELNRHYAMAWAGSRVVIIKEGTQPAAQPGGEPVPVVEFVRLQDFHAWHRNDTVNIVQGGKLTRITASKLWETSPQRRQYRAIDFRPEGAPPDVYNLWQGFTLKPDPHASCDRFLSHMRENVCRGDEALFEWVMGWFAQLIQRPHDKPGTALVLRGGRGVGKSIVGKTIGALLGPHHVPVASARLVTGQFNAHLKWCLLLQAEEAFWAGDKQAEGTLKDLITGDTLMIEYKGIDPVPVRNLVRLLATTNHDWAVPAGMDERRFAVVDVGDAHKQDHAYFAAIQQELDAAGLGALLHYLQTFDLGSVNLRTIPNTRALLEQKMQSLPLIEQWWLDTLSKGQIGDWGGWPQEVNRQQVFSDFHQYARSRGARHLDSDEWVGRKLRDFVPRLRTAHRRDGSARMRVYCLPPLDECRTYFSDLMGGGIEWDDADE